MLFDVVLFVAHVLAVVENEGQDRPLGPVLVVSFCYLVWLVCVGAREKLGSPWKPVDDAPVGGAK